MKLIVGLGNPGPKYLLTRHNIGFILVDMFLRSTDPSQIVSNFREQHEALLARVKGPEDDLILLKPMTYMNKSGEPLRSVMDYFKIPIDDILVIHDDIDQPFGSIKFQKNRGPGGHNGIKSINELLGTQDYVRLKLGVGRPVNPKMDVADYVLQNFNSEEQEELSDYLQFAIDGVDTYIAHGLDKASTQFNKSYK